jgi:translocator protein
MTRTHRFPYASFSGAFFALVEPMAWRHAISFMREHMVFTTRLRAGSWRTGPSGPCFRPPAPANAPCYHGGMEAFAWYQQLIKPTWAPPSYVFGPVWTVLYAGIFVSFGAVFVLAARKSIPRMTAAPFALNLLFNLAFTPLQFGLKNNVLASIDILLVFSTLLWAMWSIRRSHPVIGYAQIPYLLWVAFATCLQLSITYLNYR